jgi:hypothetical protein
MMTLLADHSVEELERALAQSIGGSDWQKFYDSFLLKVSQLQVLLSTIEDKNSLLSDVEQHVLSKYHILEPIDAELALRICKINVESLANVKYTVLTTNDPHNPKLKNSQRRHLSLFLLNSIRNHTFYSSFRIEGGLPSLRLKTTSSRLKTLLTFIVSIVNQLSNEKLKAKAFIKQQEQLVTNEQVFTEALLKVTQQK